LKKNTKNPLLCPKCLLAAVIVFCGAIFLTSGYLQMLKDPSLLAGGLDLGVVKLSLYGISLSTAFAVGFLVFELNRRSSLKLGEIENKIFNVEEMALWVVVFGVIGARLYHLVTDWYRYLDNPIAVFYLWNGGLGIFGGILGGAFALWLYCRKTKVSFPRILDLAAISLPLAQFIGRFGNLFNRELGGTATDLPWGMAVSGQSGLVHPTFLYEQIGDILLFAFLYWAFKAKKLIPGNLDFIISYLAGYGFIRFAVDCFRLEPKTLFGFMTTAQGVSILLLAVATAMLLARKYKQ